jgi:sugar lactone lactonase YvrE
MAEGQAVSLGNPVTFSAQGAGSGTIRYQWQKDGVDIPGAINPVLNLGAAKLDDSNSRYRVVLKNEGGSVTSAEATLKVSGFQVYAGTVSESGLVDGTLANSRFSGVTALAFDANGILYVADSGNARVRRISKSGVVGTYADSHALATTEINGLGIDRSGNLWVSAAGEVKKVTPGGVVSTAVVLPNGAVDGRSGRLFYPSGVAADGNGNIFVVNGVGLRKVTPQNVVTILEGVDVKPVSGTQGVVVLGMSSDAAGNVYYYYDPSIGIKKVARDGTVSQLPLKSVANAMAIDANGTIYTLDVVKSSISKLTPDGKETVVVAATGEPGSAQTLVGFLSDAHGIAVDANGFLYVSMRNAIVKIGLP